MKNPIYDFLISSGVEIPNKPCVLRNELQENGVIRPYVIVMPGRCGSTWMATAIQNLKKYANPIEYFSEEGLRYYWNYEKPQALEDVILGIAKKYSTNGVFGFKINPQRLEWLHQLIDLASTFSPDYAAWIYLRRWNFVKQAFSFVAAKKLASGTVMARPMIAH